MLDDFLAVESTKRTAWFKESTGKAYSADVEVTTTEISVCCLGIFRDRLEGGGFPMVGAGDNNPGRPCDGRPSHRVP